MLNAGVVWFLASCLPILLHRFAHFDEESSQFVGCRVNGCECLVDTIPNTNSMYVREDAVYVSCPIEEFEECLVVASC